MARVVNRAHSSFRGAVTENILDDLKPAVISQPSKNKRCITSRLHVVVAQPRVELRKDTVVVKRHNFLGYLELSPGHRRAVKLRNQAARRLDRFGGVARGELVAQYDFTAGNFLPVVHSQRHLLSYR